MHISAGIAIYYNNKILLAHPSKSSVIGTWSVPKGKIEENETELDAAIRELEEEVGIKLDSNIITSEPRIFNYTSKNGYIFKKAYIFTLHINSLSELGLTSEIILFNQLQRSEVDMALFFDKNTAKDYIFWRYRALLDKI